MWSSISAALCAPLMATIGIAYWERWAGSALMLNLFKCSLASTLFVVVLFCSTAAGTQIISPDSEAIHMLVLSGFLGIVVGDLAWIQAMKLIGARSCVILGAAKPLVAKLVGIICLGQPASLLLFLGISFISIGLVFAHVGRHDASGTATNMVPSTKTVVHEDETPPLEIVASFEDNQVATGRVESFCTFGHVEANKYKKIAFGVVLQIFNMIIDVAGAAITRAYGGNAGPWQINAIRFGSAAVIMLTFTAVVRMVALVRSASAPSWACLPGQSVREWLFIFLGVLLVTFLTPALGNYALFRLHFGAWSALTALGPVFSIPVFWILKGETTSMTGILGAALAVAGAAIIPMAVARSHN